VPAAGFCEHGNEPSRSVNGVPWSNTLQIDGVSTASDCK